MGREAIIPVRGDRGADRALRGLTEGWGADLGGRVLPRIAFCGPGRSGKDECAHWFAENTRLRFGRSTSEVIAPYVAARLGLDAAEAFARRHEDRVLWFEVGNELRRHDPLFLVRECLADGEIVVGMRNRDEVIGARAEGLIDLLAWIDRDVPVDPTMTYGPELCDVRIDNRGTLADLRGRLAALASFAGVLALGRPASE